MSNLIGKVAIAWIVIASFSQNLVACEGRSNQCSSSQRAVRYYIVPKSNDHSSRRPSIDRQQSRRPEINLPVMEAGTSYRLSGRNYGSQLGSILVVIGDIELECDIQTWAMDEVTFRVPPLKLKKEYAARLIVMSPDGRGITSKSVRLRGIVVQRPIEQESIEQIPEPIVPLNTVPSVSDTPFDLGQGLEGT